MIGFILNIPYTVIGLIAGLVSVPKAVELRKDPQVIILRVKSFWWYRWLPSKKGVRGMTIGHTVLLSPQIESGDLEHELIHVKQHEEAPLIHPILYYIESARKGYRNNKYEDEAYRIAGNIYKEK